MSHRYRAAQFIKSTPGLPGSPPDLGMEVAFAGRSNAGKSSAINTITEIKSLARTSKTPGRTQHLVFFGIDPQRRLVDLPGYGFAKVPEQVKRRWAQAMERYLQQRQSLQGLILVMDVRHPLTEFDQNMLNWCQHAQLPVHVLLTKADKLKRGPAKASLLEVRKYLKQQANPTTIQLFSALKRDGVEQVRQVLDQWLELGPKPALLES